MSKDLSDNEKSKNLVCSIYTKSKEKYNETLKMVNAYKIRHNFPTHSFDPFLPHQGIILLQELVEPIFLEHVTGEIL